MNQERCCSKFKSLPRQCEHLPQNKPEILRSLKLIHRYLAGIQTKKKLAQKDPNAAQAYSLACSVCGNLSRLHMSLQSPVIYCWRHLQVHFERQKAECFSVDLGSMDLYCHRCSDHVYLTDYRDLHQKWASGGATIDSEVSQHSQIAHFKDHKLGVRGLTNLGSTCFMNVLIQIFVNNPLLQRYFLEDRHPRASCEHSGVCISCEMEEVFIEMFSGKRTPYAPSNLMSSVWKIEKSLAGYEQRDSHEFFLAVLNGMQRGTQKGMNNPNLFAGTERSDVICGNCKNVSTRSEEFYHMSLDWPESLKRVATEDHPRNSSYEPAHERLTTCLQRYCSVEGIEGSPCPSCGPHAQRGKQISIERMPPILCLHLKRFKQETETTLRRKIDTYVEYEEYLDMTPYSSEEIVSKRRGQVPRQPKRYIYRLFGLINHIDQWYRCNDSIVTKTSQRTVFANGKQAYLLFYIRADALRTNNTF